MSQKSFTYTYSADRQAEVEAIRSKYAPTPVQVDPMDRLRKLDEAVTRKATLAGLILGVLSSLVLGTGMSLVMSDLPAALGISEPMIPGIVLGCLGIGGILGAYPLYHRVLKTQRAKAAPQILELADTLTREG